MFSLRKAIALLALVAASAPGSAAVISLDNFNNTMTGGDAVGGVLTAGNNTKTSGGDSGGTILGTRTVSLTESGGITANAQLNNTPAFTLVLSTGGGTTTGTTTLKYNAFGTLDLSTNDGISLNVSFFNAGGGVTAAAQLLDDSGLQSVGPVIVSGLGNLFIPFASLTGAQRDLVTEIRLIFTLKDAADLSLDAKNGVIITETVPEPMTLAAFGVMTLVGGVYGRRKLKAHTVAQA